MSSHGSHGRRDNEEGKGPGISPSRRQARSESSQNPNSDRNVAKVGARSQQSQQYKTDASSFSPPSFSPPSIVPLPSRFSTVTDDDVAPWDSISVRSFKSRGAQPSSAKTLLSPVQTQNHETMVPKSGSVGGSYIDDGQDFKSPNNASSKSYSKTATGQPAKNSAVPIDAITTYGSAIDDRGAFPDVQARAERRELGNKPRISKAEGNKSTPAEVPSKTTAPVKIPKKESAPAEHPSKDVSPLIVLKRKTTPEDTPKHQITTRDAALQTIRRTLNEYQSIIPIKNPRAQSNPPGEPEVKKEKKVLPPTSHSTYVVKDKQRGKAYVVSPPNIRKPGTSKEKSDSARGERKVNIKDRVLPPVKEETDSAVRKFNGQSESGKKPKKEQKSADRSQEPKKDQSSKPSASGKMEHKSTSAQPAHGSRQQKSSNPPQTQNKPSSTQAQRESRPKKEGQFMMSGALVKNKAATPNPTLPPTTPKQLKKCYKGYDIIDATEGTATVLRPARKNNTPIGGNQPKSQASTNLREPESAERTIAVQGRIAKDTPSPSVISQVGTEETVPNGDKPAADSWFTMNPLPLGPTVQSTKSVRFAPTSPRAVIVPTTSFPASSPSPPGPVPSVQGSVRGPVTPAYTPRFFGFWLPPRPEQGSIRSTLDAARGCPSPSPSPVSRLPAGSTVSSTAGGLRPGRVPRSTPSPHGLGWFDGPVRASNYRPPAVETVSSTSVASSVQEESAAKKPAYHW